MSYICYLEGKYDQAEKYYQQYLSTENSQTPDGKTYAIPYLLVSKQYQKVVDQCQDFKKLMQEQDTVNLQYISILQKEVKAYKGLKDFEKVAALRESIISIIDMQPCRPGCDGAEREGEESAVCRFEMVSSGIPCRIACAGFVVDKYRCYD